MSTAPRFQPSNTLADYHSILDAIVNGGFVAHVPLAFGPDWDPRFGPVLHSGAMEPELVVGELGRMGRGLVFGGGLADREVQGRAVLNGVGDDLPRWRVPCAALSPG